MARDDQFGSLQQLLDAMPSIADYLYNDTPGPHSRNDSRLTPVPAEFSNWRSEQQAWRESAVLFDQSHHMPELFLRGPDALLLLTKLGINSLANLAPGVGKQFIACNELGQFIGDCVLHDLGDQTYELISGMTLLNWVHFHAETGGYDVTVTRDNATSDNPSGRRVNFRYEVDGPKAAAIFDEVVEGGAPEIGFFRTARVRIAGVDVLALRHSMAGHNGVELSGPYDQREAVRNALIAAGEKHGLRLGGAKTYFSTPFESGWVAYPLPAIYTSDGTRAFREWLPADGWEAKYQLAGSFRSDDVEDYYSTPFELGYGHILKFDHDFIGREALEATDRSRQRRKVTLVWNKEDVGRIMASILTTGLPFKYVELPVADYGTQQRDAVRTRDGELVGLSTLCGYTANEFEMISLAMVAPEHAAPGTELVLTWGEPDGGSRKMRVERHQQTEVRVTVAPVPYAASVRALKKQAIGQTASAAA